MLDEAALSRIVADVVAQLRPATKTPAAAPAPASAAPTPAAAGAGAPGWYVGARFRPAPASGSAGRFGVFANAASAASAAADAQKQLRAHGHAGRAKVCEIVKALCTAKAVEWGKLEFEETKIGRLEHKVEKLQIVKLVPGIEWLHPRGRSGDHGITMEEFTPLGVIGAVTPVTHSVPTISGNIINMVAAGNAMVFNPHPGGARCAVHAIRTFNEAIHRELGIEHLITVIENPTIESFNELCAAPEVNLLCVTGGPGVVKAAMRTGKRAVCAGPGNPPVLVDGTADPDRAAADIIKGAAYDNNLLCIGEKEVFVIGDAYGPLLAALQRHGAKLLNGAQTAKLSASLFTTSKDAGGCSHAVLNKAFVGRDAAELAREAGVNVAADCPLLIAETDADHPLVQEEQMTSVLPIVRVGSLEEGLERALQAEHGYKHSAIVHSYDVRTLTQMAQVLDTTLLVKNGPCVAGLGLGGEGYLSYSIATTTGEGITTPLTFTRTRRCVMVEHLRIY